MPKTQQVAALPWRKGENGTEILLVTTRTTKRWVIPKGWTMDGKADYEAAEIEAFEEAGVQGEIEAEAIGSYGYLKVLRSGKARHVTVLVFSLHVNEVHDEWPEREERQRQWFEKAQALALIGEPELLPVVKAFEARAVATTEKNNRQLSFFETVKNWWQKI